jgi:hypothetical protein
VPRHSDAPELATDASRKTATDLRARLERLSALHPSSPDYTAYSSWHEAKAGFAEAWQHHKERWPRPEQKPQRKDFGATVERELAVGCDKIQAAEREITDRLKSIEAEQPDRKLAGLQFCLKGRDRMLEKARENITNKPGRTPDVALGLIPDAVRYTFCYSSHDYAPGVRSDIDRLKAGGFEMIKLKNFWHESQYKGINSQWRDERTGQRFEVQFHTALSFEAKQMTHGAYERLRTGDLTDDEELALEAFQRKVTGMVPSPPGALEIPEHS